MQKNIANAEKYTSKFLQELDDVETELNRQINYLGQVFMVFCYVSNTRNRMNWIYVHYYIDYVSYVWLHIFIRLHVIQHMKDQYMEKFEKMITYSRLRDLHYWEANNF